MSRKKPATEAQAAQATQVAALVPAQAGAGVGDEALYGQIREVLAQARGLAYRQVNQAMVLAYWNVGRLIVEHEQAGHARAAYGTRLLPGLAQRLTAEFGPGFAVQSLRNFRQLYQAFGVQEIRSTPWSELSWSHLKTLMRVADPDARRWYATEAAAQTWGVAALDRQIGTLYYERLLSNTYVRVWDERQRGEGDGPTIGMILCSEHNDAVARYSRLAEDGGPLYASRYQAWLPSEAELQAKLARDRALWELGQTEGGV